MMKINSLLLLDNALKAVYMCSQDVCASVTTIHNFYQKVLFPKLTVIINSFAHKVAGN